MVFASQMKWKSRSQAGTEIPASPSWPRQTKQTGQLAVCPTSCSLSQCVESLKENSHLILISAIPRSLKPNPITKHAKHQANSPNCPSSNPICCALNLFCALTSLALGGGGGGSANDARLLPASSPPCVCADAARRPNRVPLRFTVIVSPSFKLRSLFSSSSPFPFPTPPPFCI